MSFEHREVTEGTIGAAFEVHNVLGYGFLENVYQNAMQVEVIQRGHRCQTESQIKVHYKNDIVGEYRADLLVNEVVVVELKVAKAYQSADEAQLLNELRKLALFHLPQVGGVLHAVEQGGLAVMTDFTHGMPHATNELL